MIITPFRHPIDPIHNDFYSVAGSDISSDAVFEFTTGGVKKIVKPTFIRPHLALVAQLPNDTPPGAAKLRLKSPSTQSNELDVTVVGGPPAQPARVLQEGENKARPYTIVFVANPAIFTREEASINDPILANRSVYHDVVAHCLCNLFAVNEEVKEDLFRNGDIDERMRLVSVFDESPPPGVDISLCHEDKDNPDVMQTDREKIQPFLDAYGIVADVVLVIHGSTRPKIRAFSWYTEDASGAGTPYTFDEVTRRHGHFPKHPGSVAVPVLVVRNPVTIIHEFGHAVSDKKNGQVVDLYNDDSSGEFLINKKFRTAATDNVPQIFAEYNSKTYNADASRDGLGYGTPSGAAPGSKKVPWRSYHPEPTEPDRPNLMDDYKLADDQRHCRFDKLTYDFLRDRLNAKLSR